MNWFIFNALNGLSFGVIMFLMASGMSIVMGAMGITNLAHGALYMVGAYTGWTIAVKLNLPFLLAVLAGGLGAGLVGLVIERGFLRFLYKQPNEQVLVTFGFVYILSNLCLWVWGGTHRVPFTAKALSGSIKILQITYPLDRLTIILIGVVLAVGLWWVQEKTRLGSQVRAGMDNKEITMGLGVNLERVFASVFFGAAFIGGVAGVLGGQLMGAYQTMGLDVLLMAMIVIIVGGVGSVQGALLGGVIIGLLDAFGKAVFPEMAMFTMYLVMVIVLAIKPSGLLGRKT